LRVFTLLVVFAGPTFIHSILTSFNFAPSNVFSYGTTLCIRDSNVLTLPKIGSTSPGMYISQDVVFDETVYPFSKLNPNAGASLRVDIHLLPSDSIPTSTLPSRDEFITDSTDNMLVIPVSTNAPCCLDDAKKIGRKQCMNPAGR
jgi:hypothetical protein